MTSSMTDLRCAGNQKKGQKMQERQGTDTLAQRYWEEDETFSVELWREKDWIHQG